MHDPPHDGIGPFSMRPFSCGLSHDCVDFFAMCICMFMVIVTGTYNFFIDCTDFQNIEKLNEAMNEMKHVCSILKIKGIYERSEWNRSDF